MKTVLLTLILCLPLFTLAQTSVAPIDSSRTTFAIFLKDGGQYIGRIIARDSIKVVVRRQGGGLSYLAPSDITRIEQYQPNVRTRGRDQYNITMNDGTIYTGEILQRDSIRIVLRRRGGESILSQREIVRVERIDREGTQPATTARASTDGSTNQFPWLLYNQTALPLKANQFTYRNIWVLYNELSYGLLGFLTFRASITPSFSGDAFYNGTISTRPLLGGKLSIPLGNVHLGADVSYQWFGRNEYYFPGGGIYGGYRPRSRREQTISGFVTFGSTTRNFTIGYADLKVLNSMDRRQSVNIGFVTPIGQRLSLVSDNRILVGRNPYDYDRFSQLSGVLRLNRQRHAFDMGLLIAIRDEDGLRFYPLPYLAYNMRLSKR